MIARLLTLLPNIICLKEFPRRQLIESLVAVQHLLELSTLAIIRGIEAVEVWPCDAQSIHFIEAGLIDRGAMTRGDLACTDGDGAVEALEAALSSLLEHVFVQILLQAVFLFDACGG